MKREEAIKILSILKAAYPNSYRNMTKDEANGTISVWASQFTNIPYYIVAIAVNKLISTNTFPPSISEVKDRIRGLYWEAWQTLNANEGTNILSEQQVKALQNIIDVVEPMRTRLRNEPYILDIFEGFDGALTMPEHIVKIQ